MKPRRTRATRTTTRSGRTPGESRGSWTLGGGRRLRSSAILLRPSTQAQSRDAVLHVQGAIHRLHHFYAQLCPSCAEVNYRMRHLFADLTGRTALLTGARVKIGFEIGLKLLRAGATLIATTRFPADEGGEVRAREGLRRVETQAACTRWTFATSPDWRRFARGFSRRRLASTSSLTTRARRCVARQATTRTSSPRSARLEEALRSRVRQSLEAGGVEGKGAAIEAPEESEAATAEAPAAEIVPTLMNHAKFSRSRPRPDASASGALLADALGMRSGRVLPDPRATVSDENRAGGFRHRPRASPRGKVGRQRAAD